MALNKTKLVNDLKNLRAYMKTVNDANIADDEYANRLANLIEDYVKSAEVTVVAPTGLISVVGSPSAQANANPISIPGNPNLSPPLKGGLS